MKYVIGQCATTYQYHISVFGDSCIHIKMAAAIKLSIPTISFIGAGFVYRQEDSSWKVSEEVSESMKLCPSELDETLLNLFLVKGLQGLDLSNMIAYLEISNK